MSAGDIVFRITFSLLNVLIGAAGAVLIVIGGIFLAMSQAFISSITVINSFEQFIVSVLFNASILMIIIGAVLLGIAIIGVLGSIKHRVCGFLLILYLFIVGIILVLQIVLVIVVASRNAEAKTFLSSRLPELLAPRLQNDTLLQSGLAQVERFLKCCGIRDNYIDYVHSSLNISESCQCQNATSICTEVNATLVGDFNGNNVALVYQETCIQNILTRLEDPSFQYGLGGAALAIVVIEILLILFAICMIFLDFKKED